MNNDTLRMILQLERDIAAQRAAVLKAMGNISIQQYNGKKTEFVAAAIYGSGSEGLANTGNARIDLISSDGRKIHVKGREDKEPTFDDNQQKPNKYSISKGCAGAFADDADLTRALEESDAVAVIIYRHSGTTGFELVGAFEFPVETIKEYRNICIGKMDRKDGSRVSLRISYKTISLPGVKCLVPCKDTHKKVSQMLVEQPNFDLNTTVGGLN
jgi:hypothetical protein